MKCPKCIVDLVMSDRQGVEIDYCPQCRGVWLDRGELDKIIERSMPQMQQFSPQQNYQQSMNPSSPGYYDNKHHDKHYDHHYDKKRRKEHFLSDLFDF